MKRILSTAFVLLVVTCSVVPAQSASVVGSWDITIESPQGKRDSMLVIKQDGGKLTGAMKSPRGERPLDSVKVEGNDITFVMTANVQGQDMVFTYKGKVEKDSMKGDADFGGFATGSWSAVPHKEGAAPAPAAAPQASSGGAANISGVWNFAVETQAGSGSPTFTFKQDGENLSGSYKGQFGEAPLTGTVKGADVKFTVKVNAQGQDLTINYTGKIDGKDSMKGSASFGEMGEGTWTAKRKQ
ncbi:MAG TPA: hypothetical protein VN937_16080 [Blastocatellia bacterium]|nr:hypothetical protein [Blastocatellia bacterium]